MRATHSHRWLSEPAEALIVELEASRRASALDRATPSAARAAPGSGDFDCDVLIVGSGYGGAVAAARLAGSREADGRIARVWVLERGQEFLPGDFPARFAELPGHVRIDGQDGAAPRGRAEGLFDLRVGSDVQVLLGNGLGGGSLINAAVMERPTDDAFEAGWPAGVTAASLETAYQAAEAMLLGGAPAPAAGAMNGAPPPELPPFERLPKFQSLMALGEALGVPAGADRRAARIAIADRDETSPAGVPLKACLRCGDCATGCNHQAKRSLDTNYLAQARANGARLFCGATVSRLRAVSMADGQVDADAGYDVAFQLTDPKKARRDRDQPYVVRARRVILAAGTLGSTEILLRSGADDDGLPVADAALGHRFSTNGDLIAVAHRQREVAHCSADETQAPAERAVGPTINGLVRHRTQDQRPIVIEEFAIPGPLRRVLGEMVATTFAWHGLTRTDRSRHAPTEAFDDPLVVTDEMLDRSPVYGLMGDDGAAGRIEFRAATAGPEAGVDVGGGGAGEGGVAVVWPEAGSAPVFNRQLQALRRVHERPGGRGGSVLPNPLWHPLPPLTLGGEPLPFGKGSATTVHPLGGCPMGDGPDSGVVDRCGRVWARPNGGAPRTLPGLAVLDGSIVPMALGINPALTIAALAEHAIVELAAEWGLQRPSAAPVELPPRPVRRDLTRPAPALATRLTLRERMTGPIRLDDARLDFDAVVQFETVDVQAFLRQPRRVALQDTVLTLRAADGSTQAALRCAGHVDVLLREPSTFTRRVARALDAARRRVALSSPEIGPLGRAIEFLALCSHAGGVRRLVYEWRVTEGLSGKAGLQVGDRLRLTKRIDFADGGNPWRQLGEGTLELLGPAPRSLGRLAVDLGYFAEQLQPLVAIERQANQPEALADIASLALWVLRVVMRIHALNFLPEFVESKRPGNATPLPGPVQGQEPKVQTLPVEARPRRGAAAKAQLAHYAPGGAAPTPDGPSRLSPGQRPVLLIHGYGAGGATFAHESIPNNLVSTLLDAGRHVWVLDLRTSIGLNQDVAWTFDEVAHGDIPKAVEAVLGDASSRGAPQIDVIAHCIGAAMFSVAVLSSPTLHSRIGRVVLSQVGPLVTMTPFNRFRGFIASYLKQFLGVKRFSSAVEGDPLAPGNLLVDAALATFPYPDDDREADRMRLVPGFSRVRHRADAIFGQTMQLANVGDATLRTLDSIYGRVMVETLAQTIHYARERLLTSPTGLNELVAVRHLTERFGFPLLMIHGRLNALFEWQGSFDTLRLLSQAFGEPEPPRPPATPDPAGTVELGSKRRRFVRFETYGHQDLLIGRNAHRDVFPTIVGFLDESIPDDPFVNIDPPIRVEAPWIGPMLGRPARAGGVLNLRLALRAQPARASLLGVLLVPAARGPGRTWDFDFEQAAWIDATPPIGKPPVTSGLVDEPGVVRASNDALDLTSQALRVGLRESALLPGRDGIAVLTVHDDLPVLRSAPLGDGGDLPANAVFTPPAVRPDERIDKLLRQWVSAHRAADAAGLDLCVVELHRSWIEATPAIASPAGAGAGANVGAGVDSATRPTAALRLALASCQYPRGLVDAAPAAASLERLATRLASAAPDDRAQSLFLMGDQVYVDATAGVFDPGGGDDIEQAYRLNLTLPAWRRVTKALPTFPLPDDHEVADDWEPAAAGTPAAGDEAAAWRVYRDHLHKLVDSPAGPPFDFHVEIAGLPVYAFDSRSARQARVLRRGSSRGVAFDVAAIHPQGLPKLLHWLDEQHRRDPDRPKFIVSSTTVFPLPARAVFGPPAERIGLDDWSGYPASQFALLDHIRSRAIRNVVLLSGDRHLSSVSSLWLDRHAGDSDPVHVLSIVSSGLHAPWPFANGRADELWLDGRFAIANPSGIGTPLSASVRTWVAGSGDGFAIVEAAHSPADGWTLMALLDLADGAQRIAVHLRDGLAVSP